MQKQNGRIRFKLTRTAALALLLSAAACATTRSSRGYAPFPAEIAPLYASQAPEAKPHGDSAGFHPHDEFMLFLGYTTERADGGGTAGIDYGYRFTPKWGLGAFAEIVAKRRPGAAIGVGPTFRPVERLVLVVLPGMEFENGGHREFLTRVGGSYHAWETVALAFYVDLFLDKEAIVVGLNIELDL